MNKPKYIFFYNDYILPIPVDSIEELAKKIFGFEIFPREDGNWGIKLNGKEHGMSYTSKDNDPQNGYTKEEVEKDFLRFHFKPTYANTALYRLCDKVE